WTQGPLRLSAAARYRVRGGTGVLAPSLRASYDRERFAVAAFAELEGPDSTRRVDLSARAMPLRWLSIGGSVGQQTPRAAGSPVRSAAQADLGVEFGGRWIRAGVVQRSAARVA